MSDEVTKELIVKYSLERTSLNQLQIIVLTFLFCVPVMFAIVGLLVAFQPLINFITINFFHVENFYFNPTLDIGGSVLILLIAIFVSLSISKKIIIWFKFRFLDCAGLKKENKNA